MKKFWLAALLAISLGFAPGYAASPSGLSPLKQFSTDLADLVEKVMPSVVVVRTEAEQMLRGYDLFWGQVMIPRRSRGQGSGVVFDERGYLLTSRHVVAGATLIEVIFPDESVFKAELMGEDADTDLAVLKIVPPEGRRFKALELGDSDRIRIGEVVLAVGSPFSLSSSVTMGIVSQKGRSVGVLPFEDFIQTDAPINPGNSGGPLVDLDGRVVGINAVIQTGGGRGNIGIGFAVPANLARRVADAIIRDGRFVRPWIGIRPSGNPHPEGGITVEGVFRETPAFQAGIRSGDVLTHANTHALNSLADLLRIVYGTPEGEEIRFQVRRGRKSFNVSFAATPMEME
ncbi:MAG: trypsin-like peptidase domain-containing protein [Kiritimatiellae bacterium]|nr:trypsin-like peptidase domain-containing protein [Kiritimatiellia bacterium]